MCGRFTLTAKPEDLTALIPGLVFDQPPAPRYNIAPSQPVATVLNDGRRNLTHTQWGLIPSWAKDPAIGHRLINARSETLGEKPAFRHSYRRRRCLIPADGFYEWQKVPGRRTKQPMYFRLRSHAPFAFAGLWDEWTDVEGGILATSTIITTSPNALVKASHNRMPVVLDPKAYDQWLAPDEKKPDELNALLAPYPAEEMEAYAVSTAVNNPRSDTPDCIRPVDA